MYIDVYSYYTCTIYHNTCTCTCTCVHVQLYVHVHVSVNVVVHDLQCSLHNGIIKTVSSLGQNSYISYLPQNTELVREVEDLRRQLDDSEKKANSTAGPLEKVGFPECPPSRPLHLIEDDDQVLVATCSSVMFTLCVGNACEWSFISQSFIRRQTSQLPIITLYSLTVKSAHGDQISIYPVLKSASLCYSFSMYSSVHVYMYIVGRLFYS